MLTRILIFIVAVAACLNYCIAVPSRCEETTIQYNALLRNYSIAISADLKLISSQNQTTNITITNIKATATNISNIDGMQVVFKQMCAYGRAGMLFVCNNQFTDDLTISIGDSNVWELQATIAWKTSQFEEDDSPPFYSGVVDGNSFAFYDGRLYDDNNKCFNYGYQDGFSVAINITECCTSLKPITMANVSNAQTCTHFNTNSKITAADNSTYATIAIDYDIQNFNVTMFAKFSGPIGYQPFLIIDDAQGCDEVLNSSIYCGYPITVGGNKMLVFMGEATNYTQIYGLASKIIVRDNQTFISDDTATSPDNACQTYNYQYDPDRKLSISTTSCCTIFSNGNGSPTTTAATTTTSGAMPSSLSFSFIFSMLVAIAMFKY